jgi:hypothetical protein
MITPLSASGEVRFEDTRNINLTNFLPEYLQNSDISDFIGVFESFLNIMYSGVDGLQISEFPIKNIWRAGQSAISVDGLSPGLDIYITIDPNLTYILNRKSVWVANDDPNVQISGDIDYYDINSGDIGMSVTSFVGSGLHSVWDVSLADVVDNSTGLLFASAADDQKISILDKINRLTELHDPELIDIDYIQYFAHYLGYNIEISRDQIGQFGTSYSDNEIDANKWLRFVVGNLPNWYKIKTTNNSIRMVLYSFGLIGDLVNYFTKDYGSNFENWKLDSNANLNGIHDDWYPTPHFSVKIDIDKSIAQTLPSGMTLLEVLMKNGEGICKAVEGMRPANTVFHKLSGYTKEDFTVYVGGNARFSRYIKVPSDGASDWWNLPPTTNHSLYIIGVDQNSLNQDLFKFDEDENIFKSLNLGPYLTGLVAGYNGVLYARGYGSLDGILKKKSEDANWTLIASSIGINWSDRVINSPNGDVYAIGVDNETFMSDIYKQSAGVGSFVAIGTSGINWKDIVITSSGVIYLVGESVDGYDIFKLVNNIPSPYGFNWENNLGRLYIAPNDDVYMRGYNGVHVLTARKLFDEENFSEINTMGEMDVGARQIAVTPSNDVYEIGDYDAGENRIFKQTNGAGSFIDINPINRPYEQLCGIIAPSNNDVYVFGIKYEYEDDPNPYHTYKKNIADDNFVEFGIPNSFYQSLVYLKE